MRLLEAKASLRRRQHRAAAARRKRLRPALRSPAPSRSQAAKADTRRAAPGKASPRSVQLERGPRQRGAAPGRPADPPVPGRLPPRTQPDPRAHQQPTTRPPAPGRVPPAPGLHSPRRVPSAPSPAKDGARSLPARKPPRCARPPRAGPGRPHSPRRSPAGPRASRSPRGGQVLGAAPPPPFMAGRPRGGPGAGPPSRAGGARRAAKGSGAEAAAARYMAGRASPSAAEPPRPPYPTLPPTAPLGRGAPAHGGQSPRGPGAPPTNGVAVPAHRSQSPLGDVVRGGLAPARSHVPAARPGPAALPPRLDWARCGWPRPAGSPGPGQRPGGCLRRVSRITGKPQPAVPGAPARERRGLGLERAAER
ncbi:basic proline-rich protein-like [Nyctibius grandis]|uniref:basic proline-rich protein-like n=1 Tax=Nyctibius grandis TaxID=48427 RepID=UPI0035BC1EA4